MTCSNATYCTFHTFMNCPSFVNACPAGSAIAALLLLVPAALCKLTQRWPFSFMAGVQMPKCFKATWLTQCGHALGTAAQHTPLPCAPTAQPGRAGRLLGAVFCSLHSLCVTGLHAVFLHALLNTLCCWKAYNGCMPPTAYKQCGAMFAVMYA